MEKIITFGCQKNVFVYKEGCGLLPNPPYKKHETVEIAIQHLKEKGIHEPKVIEYETSRTSIKRHN